MLVKPNTALTGVPSDRVIGGRAWKARKMKPEPSMRTRWGSGGAVMSGTSVSLVVSGAGGKAEDARAIGAEGLLVLDMQPDAGMAERTVAAVAGDGAAVHEERLGVADGGRGCGGAERHLVSLGAAEAG